MAEVLFITHGDVIRDPAVPVPRWGLSAQGRARHIAFNTSPAVAGVTAIHCSDEQKAIDGAAILAEARGLVPRVWPMLGENDRSATGYLPPDEFQATADAFFAHPEVSIRGWERAIDAQARIVAAVEAVLAEPAEGDIAIIAHGGVGALLLCHLRGVPISRTLDQPGTAGGNWFAFDAATRVVRQGWRDISP
jgi:broad specificity phosphatase PhoE